MKLVPFNDGRAEMAKKTMYRSTMNPNEVSDKPGKDSMGMDMVPFEVGGESEATPAGLASISITPSARQRMGLTLGTIEKRALSRDVRTSARIVPNETKLYRVSVKVDGWVEKLFVSTTGQYVERGAPLLAIYSPDLVAAQKELLTAVRSGAADLTASARRRLKLWDVSDQQIAQLEETERIEKTLILYAPASGYVQDKTVIAGQKVMPGESLMTVVDLSAVWADADIYQSDLPFVKVGMPVEVGSATGTVSFVSPSLDPESRTGKARLEIPNPDLQLKPEMFATARLEFPLGEVLAIPEAAVMRTGERTYAFRDAGDGKLVPTEIIVGARSDGYFELVSGLNEGDKVVTSANFLVDSESSMKAALESLR
jgi:multidrug efflux pump subunit AcrA (membrane-fusion protein)